MVIHKSKNGEDQLLFDFGDGPELVGVEDLVDLFEDYEDEEEILYEDKATKEEIDELTQYFMKEFSIFLDEFEGEE